MSITGASSPLPEEGNGPSLSSTSGTSRSLGVVLSSGLLPPRSLPVALLIAISPIPGTTSPMNSPATAAISRSWPATSCAVNSPSAPVPDCARSSDVPPRTAPVLPRVAPARALIGLYMRPAIPIDRASHAATPIPRLRPSSRAVSMSSLLAKASFNALGSVASTPCSVSASPMLAKYSVA